MSDEGFPFQQEVELGKTMKIQNQRNRQEVVKCEFKFKY